jgi:3-deoxy-manno-octulosonate cytidylyltransferase (CMP-KDO synthetase)
MGGRTLPMVQWVYEQATQARTLDAVVVATDDVRIFNAVKNFGGNVAMTQSTHANGTARCAELLDSSYKTAQIIVNIQGDEPQIQPQQIDALANVFVHNNNVQIATLIKPITDATELIDPNCVKAVVTPDLRALYFSRAALPHQRDISTTTPELWLQKHIYYKHLGLYAYSAAALRGIVALQPTPLELAENLEQLRWLECGYTIHTALTHHQSIAIDTPADLHKLHGLYP